MTKQPRSRPHNKIKELFIPPVKDSLQNYKELIPVLLMVTLVMVGLYGMELKFPTVQYSPLRLIGLTGLFMLHLLLYWMILNFVQTENQTVYFLVMQGLLAFLIVLVSGNIFLAIGLYASISGTSIGMLERKRLAVSGIGLYVCLALLSFIILSDLSIIGEFLPILVGAMAFSVFFAFLFNRQVKARDRAQKLLEDLEIAHKQLSEYALEVENLTLTGERQRMARELHDTLAQGLAGLILQLEAADSQLSGGHSSKAQEIVQQAMTRARSTLADARMAIDDLRESTTTPQDMIETIEEEVERFRHTTGIPCSLNMSAPADLSPELAENVLRAISEGLMNIARHAQASQASVETACAEQSLQIEIHDNGIGFDPENAIGQSGHYGLLGMRERARIWGGSLTIESDSSRGTTLKLDFPLRGEQ